MNEKKQNFYAERIPSGWAIHQGGTPSAEAVILTAEQFEALCEERAQIDDKGVISWA